MNPSPYLFLVELGEARALVGASPELLVQVRDGDVVVRPIAGTRRRGATEAEDLALEKELLADEKERAEHVMLVDLGRNDVGRVAAPGIGARRGPDGHRALQPRDAHRLAGARASWTRGYDALDALASTFPAGTVSGAPKIRAMQIIDELEPHAARALRGRGGLPVLLRHAGRGHRAADLLRGRRPRRCGPRARAWWRTRCRSKEADETEAKAGAHGRRAAAGARGRWAVILVIDNYDSFTFNLVQLLYTLGAEVKVVRNDELDAAGVRGVGRLAPGGVAGALHAARGGRERGGHPQRARAGAGRVPGAPVHRRGVRRQGGARAGAGARQGGAHPARRHGRLHRA